MVEETPDNTEELEDTDSLGEQPEFTQMEHHQMLVHNTSSMENRHIFAENRYPVRGYHMLLVKHKTLQQHEKMTSSEKIILDKYLLILY